MSISDYVAKYPRRLKLRETVETYWLEEPRKPPGALDSSLKKHTTLLNRLRTLLLVGPAEPIIKDIDGLTLSKYLEEIVGAVVEGASKGKGDPEVAVDIIAHLHTRLSPDFLPRLLPALLSILAPSSTAPANSKDVDKEKEKEDKERLGRQRPVLRMVAELAISHAWPEGVVKGIGEVAKVLKNLMSNDPAFINLPLLATFLKYFERAYLGGAEVAGDAGDTSGDLPAGVDELVPAEERKTMRSLFVSYFNSASKTLVKGQVKLLEQDKRNHEAYIKSGEIFEDRQQAYERMTKAVERLTTGVQSLADLLSLKMPDLPTSATLSKGGLQIVESISSFTVREEGQGVGIWDDEEEKRFYEDLIDLKEVVPNGLLGIKEKKDTAAGEAGAGKGEAEGEEALERQKQEEEDIQRQLDQMMLDPAPDSTAPPPVEEPEAVSMSRSASKTSAKAPGSPLIPTNALPEDEDGPPADSGIVGEDEGLQPGPAARLTALFAALPEAVNREIIDKLAVEFAFLNSKAARKRLIKFLSAVPKNRTDLLPHYARFIATLDRCMPDVGTGVIEVLEEELRYLQRKKRVRELDSLRLKNVRFYGELAKFKVARPYAILHVLKVFLDDFKPNIENMSNLLETCGRFLLRNEGTAATAKSMVELMRRKQASQHLEHKEHVMLENAFYQCNPPERVTREVVELPPMQGFIQHLLHDVLIKRTLDKVLRLLRKLHWEDAEIYDYILKSFTEIWEIKFGNIPFLAALVYDLQRYHPEFSIAVVDQLMEDIRIGMEENIFKHNQRRISTLKYLGELYMYRVVNASIIFETLWSLISFGHTEGLPVPGRDSPIDAVDDFFRIRLVCTLLDTCGICFDRGSQKRKLDHFLTVFQLYVTCKKEIPMDVEFMLNDTLDAMRPKTAHLRTFAEAAAAVDVLLAEQNGRVWESDSEDGGDEEGERGGADREDGDEEVLNTAAPDEQEGDEDDDAEDVVVIRERSTQHDEVNEEAQSDFDREFARMLADTTDTRRGERKAAPPIFDTAVPHIRRQAEGATAPGVAASGKAGPAAVEQERMQFSLLSKKGNKQQIREIAIPVDSAIAVNSRTHQLQNKAEQEQLKRLVLQNERRQGQSDKDKLEQDMRARGIRLRFTG